MHANSLPQTILYVIAVIIGVVAVYLLIRLNRRLGGKLNIALRLFVGGVISNTVAIIWTLSGGPMFSVGGALFDVHHLLMTLGMIFFIFSVHRFSSLVSA